ncbi:MAG: phosphoribosylglycinamide formyltransferase [Gammaproteobacteria bacterium]|nr:phosphoribosylglycinamide formyltransferase [Gammaproteobacteria bacterium]
MVVLVSGRGSNLQALMDAVQDGTIPGRIAAVIGNRPGAYALERARRAGIPCRLLDHRGFPSREAFDRALAALMDEYGPHLVVMAGFMRVLTPAFIAHFRGRMLNIHPSLLPAFPGLHTHERAIAAGVAEHGATVHFVTEEVDGGPAVVQARVPVEPDDTPEALAARVLEQEHRIFPAAVAWFCSGRLRLADGLPLLDGRPLAQPLQGTTD